MSFNRLLILLVALFTLNGCIPSNTYEKNEALTFHKWDKEDVKSYHFEITDTTSKYLMFVTMRHTDAYHFANIWLDLETEKPNKKRTKQKIELPLAETSGRWTGKGMNEIYEHKIRLSGNSYTKFDQMGTYTIKLHQIMRENPLEEILSIGIRLERVPSSQ